MKRLSIFYILPLLLFACTQEETVPNAAHEALMRIITDDVITRMTVNGDKFEVDDDIVISVYNQYDKPYVSDDGGNWYLYKYDGETWKINSWQEEVKLSEEKAKVYAAYPTTDMDLMYGLWVNVGVSDGGQQEYLYASSEGHNYENPTVHLQFHYALSMVTVNMMKGQQNSDDEITVSSATLKNAENSTGIAISGNMRMPSGDIDKYEDSKDALTLNVNQPLSVTTPVTTNFLVIPTETNDGVILSLLINDKEREVRIPTTKWEKGKRYTYNVTVEGELDKYLSISEATITPREKTTMETLTINAEVLPIGGTIGTSVDLGLSVKWADHNVGAVTESEVGGKYMWGDPTGTATTSTYSQPNLTEISGMQYDLATTQWGSQWRLPTRDEIKELINNTSYVWTLRDGVYGGLFTSKIAGYTNKSIFIPYYGSYNSSTGIKVGDVWSGTRSSSTTTNAYILYFNEESVTCNYSSSGSYRKPVRPVCK